MKIAISATGKDLNAKVDQDLVGHKTLLLQYRRQKFCSYR